MKLLNLELESFQSYVALQRLTFSSGLWYVTATNKDGGVKADSNGSGKTALLNSICWAMYGKTPSGITGKAIISHGMLRACVRLELGPEYGIPELVITREHTLSKGQRLGFVYKGETFKGDLKYLQPKIDKILDVSFETFCSTIYLGRNAASVQFLFAPPSKRSEILSDLVNDRIFQEAAKILESRHKGLQDEMMSKRQERSALLGRQEEIAYAITQLDSSLICWEADEEDRVTSVREALYNINRRRTSLISALATPPIESVSDLGLLRAQVYQQRENTRREILELTALSGLPPESLQTGATCIHCHQVISQEVFEKHVEMFKVYLKQRKVLEDSFNVFERDLEETDRKLSIVRNWKQQSERTIRELEEIKFEETTTKDKLHPREPSVITGQIQEARVRSQEISQQLLESRATLDRLPREIKTCQDLYLGFKTEIRNILFDALRDSLEYYTDFYLQILTGGEFKVTYPTRADVAKEKFEIILYAGSYEQDISNYSEGEAWRASFAVLLALRRVLADKSKNRLEFLLVDDPVGGLDLSGIQEFLRLLEKLTQEEVPHILATVPRSDILNSTKVIHVIKEGRVSRIDKSR